MPRGGPKMVPLGKQLGMLAMAFRGTRDTAERARIADQYAAVVARLIAERTWKEIPPPEDQLPDDWMPLAFYQHWSLPSGNGKRKNG